MKRIKFYLTGVFALVICSFLFCLSAGANHLSAPEAVASEAAAMIPEAGGVTWVWLGAALILCAVGIIILVLSRRRK